MRRQPAHERTTKQRNENPATVNNRVSLIIKLDDRPGALHDLLGHFKAQGINLTNIESRPTRDGNFSFFVDFIGTRSDPNIKSLLEKLQHSGSDLTVLDDQTVPWFPRHVWELDLIANRTLDAGTDLASDHPGFADPEYRAQRSRIEQLAREYRYGQPLPEIDYTEQERQTWRTVYETMRARHAQHACPEYQLIMGELEARGIFSPSDVPQARAVSDYLAARTGFNLRPVAGLLQPRDFLNGLAFRVFFSTQYIRHHSRPHYTPEPDLCHELLGHAPMFADPAFADFSHEIGLASIGASDAEITRLARCYWHSVEFGVIRSQTGLKAYGAGLLSSFGEIEHACAPESEQAREIRAWDPETAADQDYPITDYQPVYFAADSLTAARLSMRDHCRKLPRMFYARYVEASKSIWVDRAVRPEKLNV